MTDPSRRTVLPLGVVPSVAYDTFWQFAAERQRIFCRRLRGLDAPWTNDPILAIHKFTNAYRASDRVSQFLIRNVIYRDDLPGTIEEVFFRIILFKMFNKIDTWIAMENAVGHITWEDFNYPAFDHILSGLVAKRRTIYSAAYIMPPSSIYGERRKYQNHFRLLEAMMRSETPKRVSDAGDLRSVYVLLRAFPSIGNFLAYQFAIDINYSEITNFSEMDFVVPGPGARDGIRKCFTVMGNYTETDIIKFVADIQEIEFQQRGIRFRTLWGRKLQLVDCQNLFCEVDKYSRLAHPELQGHSGRTRIKRRFHPSGSLNVWYPPKWGINESIANSRTETGLFEVEEP